MLNSTNRALNFAPTFLAVILIGLTASCQQKKQINTNQECEPREFAFVYGNDTSNRFWIYDSQHRLVLDSVDVADSLISGPMETQRLVYAGDTVISIGHYNDSIFIVMNSKGLPMQMYANPYNSKLNAAYSPDGQLLRVDGTGITSKEPPIIQRSIDSVIYENGNIMFYRTTGKGGVNDYSFEYYTDKPYQHSVDPSKAIFSLADGKSVQSPRLDAQVFSKNLIKTQSFHVRNRSDYDFDWTITYQYDIDSAGYITAIRRTARYNAQPQPVNTSFHYRYRCL